MANREKMLEALEQTCRESECAPDCVLYKACRLHEDKAFVEMDDVEMAELYEVLTGDPVNSPDHYTVGGIEVIDFIRAKLTPEEFEGYCKGNVLKYLSRAGHKDDKSQEYSKALKYMEWLCNK